LPWQLQNQFQCQITLVLAEIVESHSNNVAHLKSSSCGFGGIADEITKLAPLI
jgi:hypothetical protein